MCCMNISEVPLKTVLKPRILQHDWNKHLWYGRGFSETSFLTFLIWASLFRYTSCKCVCVCVSAAQLYLLLCLWCNILDCERGGRGKKYQPAAFGYLLIFSLGKLAIGQRSDYRFSPPPLVKWNLKLPPLPSFLSHFAGCSSRQTLQPVIYIMLLFSGLWKAEGLFSPRALVFVLLCLWPGAIIPTELRWQYLCISYGSWFQIDLRNPCWSNGGNEPR